MSKRPPEKPRKPVKPSGPSVQYRKMLVSKLAPAGYNPRRISDASLAGLGASMDRFGCVQPVIWNQRTGKVVGGHQRLRVLLDRGEKFTSVCVVDLPESEEKALNVALNNPAIAGEFTDDLAALLAEIQADEPDLYGSLLLAELSADGADLESVEFREYDETAADSVRLCKCPKCGEEFPV